MKANGKFIHVVGCLIIVVFMVSCGSYEYANQMPQEPMFTGKGEVHAVASPSLTNLDVQFAYAPWRNWGLGTNLFVGNKAFSGEMNLMYFKSIANRVYFSAGSGFVMSKIDVAKKVLLDRFESSRAGYYGFNAQASIYKMNPKNDGAQGLAIKWSRVLYTDFYRQWDYASGSSSGRYTVTDELKRPGVFDNLTAYFIIRKDHDGWYTFFQGGASYGISKLDLEHRAYGYYAEADRLPMYNWILLNFGIGLCNF